MIGESDGNECILLLPPKGRTSGSYDPETGFDTENSFEGLMVSSFEV